MEKNKTSLSHLLSATNLQRKINRYVVPKFLYKKFGSNTTINVDALRHTAVYPKLNVAFNRIKKNANSTSVILFRELDTGLIEHEAIAKRNSLHLEKIPFRYWFNLFNFKFVIIIRNPYTRVLSAFINKFKKQAYIDRYREYPLTPDGFREFVLWLKKGGITSDPHWDLQCKLMLAPAKGYDTVIRFESLSKEMTLLLQELDFPLTENALKLLGEPNNTHKSFADSQLESYYTPEICQIISELYETDFERLGYSLELPI